MRFGFAAGIGLFLVLVGLHETGIVVAAPPPVPIRLGDLHEPTALLTAAGVVMTAGLLARGMRGAVLVGMVVMSAAGVAVGLAPAPDAIFSPPLSPEHDLRAVALQLDVAGVLRPAFLPVLLTLVLMSFLDTLGTLIAVGNAAGLADHTGDLPDIERPM